MKKSILITITLAWMLSMFANFSYATVDRVKWKEFRGVYTRINKTKNKVVKYVDGIMTQTNNKNQLVYDNDEYVDRFIVNGNTYARVYYDVTLNDESVLFLSNSSAIYGYDWPSTDHDKNLLDINDSAVAYNLGGLGGVKTVNDAQGGFEKIVVDTSANTKYKRIDINATNSGTGLFNYNAVNVNSINLKGYKSTVSAMSSSIDTTNLATITYDNIAGSVENAAFLVNMNDDLIDYIGEWNVGNYPMNPILNGKILGNIVLNGGATVMNVSNIYIGDASKTTSGLDRPYIDKITATSGANIIYNSGDIGEITIGAGLLLNDSIELKSTSVSTPHLVSGHIRKLILTTNSAMIVNNENAVIDELILQTSAPHTIHNKGILKSYTSNLDDDILGYGTGRLEISHTMTNYAGIYDSTVNIKNGGVYNNNSSIFNSNIVVEQGGAFYDAFKINDDDNSTTGQKIEGGAVLNSGIFHTKNILKPTSIENTASGNFTATGDNLSLSMEADSLVNSGTMLIEVTAKDNASGTAVINYMENKGGTMTIINRGSNKDLTIKPREIFVSGGEVILDNAVFWIGYHLNVGTNGILTVKKNGRVDSSVSDETAIKTWVCSGTINVENGGTLDIVNLDNTGKINISGDISVSEDLNNLDGGTFTIKNGGTLYHTVKNYGNVIIEEGGSTYQSSIHNYGVLVSRGFLDNNATIKNFAGTSTNYGTFNREDSIGGGYAAKIYNLKDATFINEGQANIQDSGMNVIEDKKIVTYYSYINYGRWEQGENAIISAPKAGSNLIDRMENKGVFVNRSIAGDRTAFEFDKFINFGTFENDGTFKIALINEVGGTIINRGNLNQENLTNNGTLQNESNLKITHATSFNTGLIQNKGTIEVLVDNAKLGSVEMNDANAKITLDGGKNLTLENSKLLGGTIEIKDSSVLNIGTNSQKGGDLALLTALSSKLNIEAGSTFVLSERDNILGDVDISERAILRIALAHYLKSGKSILNRGTIEIGDGVLNRSIGISNELKSGTLAISGTLESNADIFVSNLRFIANSADDYGALLLASGTTLDFDSIYIDTNNLTANAGDEVIFLKGFSGTFADSLINLGFLAEKYIEGTDYYVINDSGRFGIHFSSTIIPEPSTYAAFLAALALLMVIYKRTNK